MSGQSIRGIKKTRSMSNQTCHFGGISGLPPRVGVSLRVLLQPEYGLHCNANNSSDKCCCLPISQTWHMNCKDAKSWLNNKGYLTGSNQVYSGGVGNRVINMLK